MSDIVWEDPPHPQRSANSAVWPDRLRPLHERPGVWARVLTCESGLKARGVANNLKADRIKTIDHRLYEFATRALPDGSGGVYARYIGNGSS